MREAEIGSEADGFFELSQCGVGLIGAGEKRAQKVMRFGKFGVGFHGCFGLPLRFIEAAQAGKSHCIVHPYVGVAGFDPNGAGKVVFGLRKIPVRGEQMGQIAEGIGMIGLRFERIPEIAFRFDQVTAGSVPGAKECPGIGHQRVECNCLLKGREGVGLEPQLVPKQGIARMQFHRAVQHVRRARLLA